VNAPMTAAGGDAVDDDVPVTAGDRRAVERERRRALAGRSSRPAGAPSAGTLGMPRNGRWRSAGRDGGCEAAGVECPYCHVEMRPGWVTTRGIALQPQIVSVNWFSSDEPRAGSVVLAPRGFRRPTRGARCCPDCEAVVVEPKPAE
jgi:hypothetical protein